MSKVKIRVLVVDDEIAITKALSMKLEKEGFDVLVGNDGEEGFNLAEKERPDIVLLDIVMPSMNGLSVMKKIREIPRWGENVPIVMLTNLGDPENVAEAARFGVYDFLVKTDWRLDDVVRLVNNKVK